MTSRQADKTENLVIFGITGDLAQRKLLPALDQLAKAGYLSKNFRILGLSRRKLSASQVLPKTCSRLRKYTSLLQVDTQNPESYKLLKKELAGSSQNVFYLAVPPAGVLPIVQSLGKGGLNKANCKLLLEKPFGIDLASARSLVGQIQKYFDEGQVYRIDHYLAKEAAQNIAVFLGGNAVFREVWSKDYIDSIQIIASEEIGIENRIDFWEATGTLRDFVQSHILQLAALVLMEPCDEFEDFDRMPSLRLAALKRLKIDTASAVRGQYIGYRQEVANSSSASETFVSLGVVSSDPRWRGVPILLATGKKLDQKLTEIRVQFKKIGGSRGNKLVLRIQPREGIEFDLWVKKPGPVRELKKLSLDFNYQQYFARLPDAYEQVLLDVLSSNHSLFASSDEVLESWRIIDPVLKQWQKSSDDLIFYKPGASFETLLTSFV